MFNPLLYADAEFRQKTTNNNNITASYSYNILKNLSFKSTIGYIYNKYFDWQFSDSATSISITTGSQKPVVSLDSTITRTLTNNNVLNYTVRGFRGKHDFSILVGEETYELKTTVENRMYKLFPNYIKPYTAIFNTSNGTSFTGYPRVAQV
ncbi:MAG: hypothetical protein WDM90_09520 [Ferruginibacter sp.]